MQLSRYFLPKVSISDSSGRVKDSQRASVSDPENATGIKNKRKRAGQTTKIVNSEEPPMGAPAVSGWHHHNAPSSPGALYLESLPFYT